MFSSFLGGGSHAKTPNLFPAPEHFPPEAYFGELEPQDTEWAAVNSNFVVETQTWYSVLEDGQCLSVQILHSHVGLWYPQIQLNFMLYTPGTKTKLWKSINVTNFSTPPARAPSSETPYDKRSSSSDQFTCLHSMDAGSGDETYQINAKLDDDVQVVLSFVRRAGCKGFKLGKGPEGGVTAFGKSRDAKERDGFVVHRFWPRLHSEGQVIVKGQLVDAKGEGAFIHAIQGMRPNLVARTWNFILFQSAQHGGAAGIQMEFETTSSYGLASRPDGPHGVKINIGALVLNERLVSVSASTQYPGADASSNSGANAAEHRALVRDEETTYDVPTEVRYVWDGAAIGAGAEGKKVAGEVVLPLGGWRKEEARGLVEKVDVLAAIPYFVKKVVNAVAGAKPYIYQYLNPATLTIEVPEGIDGVESGKLTIAGTAFTEQSYVSQ